MFFSRNSSTSVALIASLGGFLLGYDIAVISATIETLNKYFALNDMLTGWVVSAALLGSLIGSLFSYFINDYFGRKNTLIVATCCYTMAIIATTLAPNVTLFIFFRILGGVALGLSTIVLAYLAEISISTHSKKPISFYQITIPVGIIAAHFVNFLIFQVGDFPSLMSEHSWRWLFGSEILPVAVFALLLYLIPESPYLLMMHDQEEEAFSVLKKLGHEEPELLCSEITASLHNTSSFGSTIFREKKTLSTFLALLILIVLQQMMGMNALLYYAARISDRLWSGVSPSMVGIFLGAIYCFASLLNIKKIKSFQLKKLLICATALLAICQLFIGLCLSSGYTGTWMLFIILVYVFLFSYSLRPLICAVIMELVPNPFQVQFLSYLGFAISLGTSATLLTFPLFDGSAFLSTLFGGGFPFFFYASCALLMVLVSSLWLPKMQGRVL